MEREEQLLSWAKSIRKHILQVSDLAMRVNDETEFYASVEIGRGWVHFRGYYKNHKIYDSGWAGVSLPSSDWNERSYLRSLGAIELAQYFFEDVLAGKIEPAPWVKEEQVTGMMGGLLGPMDLKT